jgi:MscS family membrane protein
MDIQQIAIWFTGKGWMLQAFLIILASLILHYIETRVYKRVFARLQKTRTIWDDALVYAMHKPLGLLIWVLGISFAGEIVGAHAEEDFIFTMISPVREFAILLVFVWFLIRFISYIEDSMIKKVRAKKYEALDRTTVHALCQIFRAAVIITAILIGLQIFGIPISGVIAFGGVGGLAAGFAAKDMLANFFGGLMIYLDRPFSVGDWVRSPDKNIEGTVEHIGWRLTRIRTFDKRPLFVPNGMFSTISIENPSRMTNRRIKETINLRYDDATKVADILQDIEKMLHTHPAIDTEQTLMVNLIACASWSLDFMIYAFTKTTNWVEYRAVRQDVFLKMLEIITAHKAECAFPTSTIHIPEGVSTK